MSANLFTRWSSVILSAFGLVCDLRAQHIVPSVEWERLYADEACDFYQVTEASDQGYVLSGRIFDEAAQAMRYDNSVVKVDGRGSVQWTKVYGGIGNEITRSLHRTTDGGYILASASDSILSGNKNSPNFGQNDVWVVKLDAEGRKQWERSVGGSGDDTPIEIWQTMDERFMLVAILPGTVGEPYYWLTKLSAQGQTEWERSLEGSENGNLGSLARAADGGYVLAGASHDGPFGGGVTAGSRRLIRKATNNGRTFSAGPGTKSSSQAIKRPMEVSSLGADQIPLHLATRSPLILPYTITGW